MRTHKKHGHGHARKHNGHARNMLKPKKAGKRTYAHALHHPGQTLGLAALATGLCVSLIYAKKIFK